MRLKYKKTQKIAFNTDTFKNNNKREQISNKTCEYTGFSDKLKKY